jgi:hypothetical protein
MNMRMKYILPLIAVTLIVLTGCVNNEDSPGLEYMPDMYRSPAIEAYVDYGQDPYQVGEETAVAQRLVQSARKPVAGSIAFIRMKWSFPCPMHMRIRWRDTKQRVWV